MSSNNLFWHTNSPQSKDVHFKMSQNREMIIDIVDYRYIVDYKNFCRVIFWLIK